MVLEVIETIDIYEHYCEEENLILLNNHVVVLLV
jgi:hypothetical protein